MTKDEKNHMGRVQALGCMICGSNAQVHHIRTGQGLKRASHYETIPLCPVHHTTGGYGVAIHAGKKEWEKRFGLEIDFLEEVRKILNVEMA